MPPKILLSSSVYVQNYLDAMAFCGADATWSYCPAPDASDYDGLVLCGGVDLHPGYYGEPIAGSERIDDARDRAEMAVLRAFLDAGKPIMGICRGHQLINVYFGGSLHQHIPQTPRHLAEEGDAVHFVDAVENSLLHRLYGAHFAVNSSHHQAIKTLGSGLVVTAVSDDGVIEAVSHTDLPLFAVQWHPERLCGKHQREDAVDGAPLLGHFIALCQAHASRPS